MLQAETSKNHTVKKDFKIIHARFLSYAFLCIYLAFSTVFYQIALLYMFTWLVLAKDEDDQIFLKL